MTAAQRKLLQRAVENTLAGKPTMVTGSRHKTAEALIEQGLLVRDTRALYPHFLWATNTTRGPGWASRGVAEYPTFDRDGNPIKVTIPD